MLHFAKIYALCLVLVTVKTFQPNCETTNQFRFYCFSVEYCNSYSCHSNNCGRFLKSSRIVRVEGTKIIPKCAFTNSDALRYIYAVNGKIEVVASGSFVNLSNLETINLSFNVIKQIHSDTFKNVSTNYLDLSWNKLVYIQEGAFCGLHNLRYLNLSRNELSTLPIHSLSLSLIDLNLSYNLFQRILLTSKRTPNLTDIDLSYNKLTKIALSFENPLRRIDLAHNELTKLDLLDIPSCEELKLSSNQFSSIPESLVYLKVGNVSLYPNPWKCDELTDLWTQLQNNFVDLMSYDDPVQTEGSSPICVASEQMAVQLSKSYDGDVRICGNDEHCDEHLVCRNERCLDPCRENVCHPTSVCEMKNHRINCLCTDNRGRDPKDIYSPCLDAECFSHTDCLLSGYCNRKQKCDILRGDSSGLLVYGYGSSESNRSFIDEGSCDIFHNQTIVDNSDDDDDDADDSMWWVSEMSTFPSHDMNIP